MEHLIRDKTKTIRDISKNRQLIILAVQRIHI